MMMTVVLPLLAIALGLFLLLWSANQFVSGAAVIAHHLKIPAIIIGMVIVGFGTSMPELIVSGVAAKNGNPGLSLGNAYGSNIANIGLILGLTALIAPIKVASNIIQKEIPILFLITLFAFWQISDSYVSYYDALGLLCLFFSLIGWSIYQGFRHRQDAFAQDVRNELQEKKDSIAKASGLLIVGLIVLIISSRLFVWGAVSVAYALGVSDLIIGLTIVAIGTSLPELASSIIAIKKNEHDLALGNVLGSNLFNTLAVVGVAGMIKPFDVPNDVFSRDWPVMAMFTMLLYFVCFGFRQEGGVRRWEGGAMLLLYLTYLFWLLWSL